MTLHPIMNELKRLSSAEVEWIRIGGRVRGVKFHRELTEAQWWEFLVSASALDDAAAIVIGDALVATDRFVPRKDGDTDDDYENRKAAFRNKYAAKMKETGLSYQTLAIRYSVCRRVPVFRRRKTTTFAHMQEVAALGDDEQAKFLTLADEKGLSVSDLRKAIRLDKRVFDACPPPPIRFNSKAWATEGLRGLADYKEWAPKRREQEKADLRAIADVLTAIMAPP